MASTGKLSDARRRELTEAFQHFDKNNDGNISAAELTQVMQGFSTDLSQVDIDEMMRKADVDGNGFIDLEEFLRMSALSAGGGEERAHLVAAFNTFDANHDGHISPHELHKLMSRIGERVTLQDCRDMISTVDHKGEGKVDFEDFSVMMQGA